MFICTTQQRSHLCLIVLFWPYYLSTLLGNDSIYKQKRRLRVKRNKNRSFKKQIEKKERDCTNAKESVS